ncbi:MAG: transcription termination factor NusA [Candidatus Gracilibacteria bacterium]
MQTPFAAAIAQLCDEKGISRDKVVETIKAAIRAAYKKDYGTRDMNVDVDLDENSGNATVFAVKMVAKEVENDELEISVKEAKKYKESAKVGDELRIDVTPPGYGRIAAQSAKQVIIQRIQEAERDVMYELFKDRENELINALIHRVDGDFVYVNLDSKITTILPREEQIPGERYFSGQRLKLYLDKVIKTTKGPQLLISRRHPKLVQKLMELEIPEVKSGLVVVKAIAREAGVRCKVAVASSDPKIDPIGSCVGQKGVRVQAVMDELNNERIDIIQHSDQADQYIKAALSPAKISQIVLDDRSRRASIYVATDQRPLAIGKQGQNVRLASILTGWELDIKDLNELSEKDMPKKSVENVTELGIDEGIVAKLSAAGLTQVGQLKGLSEKDLVGLEGLTADEAKVLVDAIKGA